MFFKRKYKLKMCCFLPFLLVGKQKKKKTQTVIKQLLYFEGCYLNEGKQLWLEETKEDVFRRFWRGFLGTSQRIQIFILVLYKPILHERHKLILSKLESVLFSWYRYSTSFICMLMHILAYNDFLRYLTREAEEKLCKRLTYKGLFEMELTTQEDKEKGKGIRMEILGKVH